MIPYILAAVGGYLIGDSLKGKQFAEGGMMAKGGKIDYSKQTSDDFKLGEIVWDIDNKRYGTIIGIYDDYPSDKFEVRLDTDGMQPTENLRKLGCEGDKGTKEQLKEEIDGYARLVKSYPKNNYPKQLDSKMSDGGYMMAKGGKTESQEELLDAAIASKELKEKARKKIKDSDAVLAVGYTDYGGTFGDKVLIEYFKKKYPKNIVYERAGYNGQNAILFGEPVQEYLDGSPDFEDFYMEMQMELEKKEFKDFIKYLKDKKYKVSPNTLAWLLDNYQEIGLSSSIEPNGIDFSPERLEEVLIEEGLIKKL